MNRTKRKKSDVLRRLWKDYKLACVATVVLGLIILLVILSPVIAPYDPAAMDLAHRLEGSSPAHWLGTDSQGRDILSRLLTGGYTALLGPLCVVGIGLAAGVPLGLISGYTNGRADNMIMRVCDVILSFPAMLLALITVSIFGRGIRNTVVILGFFYIPTIARMVRSNVIVQKEQAYVEACRAIGFSAPYIMVRHILPNCFSTIIVQATLCMGYALLDISAMSFLGLGVQEPQADWGKLLADGKNIIMTNPILAVSSGIIIMITIICINLMGEALDAYFDPRRKKV